MNTFEIISLVFNIILGGSWVITFATLRSIKKEASHKADKAAAAARADEIKNVDSAIKIWREIAENMTDKYSEMSERCDKLDSSVLELSREVNRLRVSNNKIVKLLDKITPENLENVVTEIKNELNKVKE